MGLSVKDRISGIQGWTLGRGHLSEVTQDNQGFKGPNVWEISELLNQDPIDVVFDLLVEEGCFGGMVAFTGHRAGRVLTRGCA